MVPAARGPHLAALLAATALVAIAASAASAGVVVPSTSQRTGTNSTSVGDRRITVPSGSAFYGSRFQAMSPDGAHVFVISGSDLAGDGDIGGVFEYVAGRVLRRACPGCTSVWAVTDDGAAIVAQNSSGLGLFEASGRVPISGGNRFEAMTGDAGVVVTRGSGSGQLYRWMRSTGRSELISSEGWQAQFYGMSADGRHVVFDHTGTSLLDWSPDGVTELGPGDLVSISASGSRILFNTPWALSPDDQDTKQDGYLHDADGFHLLTPGTADYASVQAMNADGSALVIAVSDQLTADDTDANVDHYLIRDGVPTLISQGSSAPGYILLDADFASAVYETDAGIVPDDTDGTTDVYRWTASAPGKAQLLTGMKTGFALLKAYAPDGSRTFITSSSQLVPEDTDGYLDLFEYVDGSLRLTLPGLGNYDIKDWTPDLARVVVQAAELTEEDLNGLVEDVYMSDADLSPPFVEVTPPGPPSGPDIEVRFSTVGDAAVWFDCSLDAGAWSVCASPTALTGLSDGSHTFEVRAWDAAANSGDGAATWTTDAIAPAGTISIAGGAPVCNTTSVAVDVTATDVATQVAMSNDGVSWTTRAYAPRQQWILPAGNGTLTVWAKWLDAAGNWSAPASDSIVLDTVAPTTSAVRDALAAGASVSGGRIPVALAWTSTDATSGIARYELAQSTDGSAYGSAVKSLTSTATVRSLTPGHAYRFRVRGIDGAGNVGAWTAGTSFTISAVQETSLRVMYSGSWRTGRSANYWAGSTRYSTTSVSKATLRITGRSFAWVAAVGPTRGSAKVYVNGVLEKTVSLYASTSAARRLVFTRSWSTSATRTLVIRVVGTRGHPRVDIDGFAWIR